MSHLHPRPVFSASTAGNVPPIYGKYKCGSWGFGWACSKSNSQP